LRDQRDNVLAAATAVQVFLNIYGYLSLQGMCAPIRKTDSALNPIDFVQIGTIGVYLPQRPSLRGIKPSWGN